MILQPYGEIHEAAQLPLNDRKSAYGITVLHDPSYKGNELSTNRATEE